MITEYVVTINSDDSSGKLEVQGIYDYEDMHRNLFPSGTKTPSKLVVDKTHQLLRNSKRYIKKTNGGKKSRKKNKKKKNTRKK